MEASSFSNKKDVLAILELLACNAGLQQLSSDLGSSARSWRLSGVSTASTGSSSSEHDSHYDKKERSSLKAFI